MCNCNVNNLADWIMVIITAIYVGATIAIFITNRKSEKAAYSQLEVSKQQFEETKRLECLPCFDLQIKTCKTGDFQEIDLTEKLGGEIVIQAYELQLYNIGKGISKNTKCSISTDSLKEQVLATFPLMPLQKCIMLYPMFCADTNGFKENIISAIITLTFDDLLGNKYMQDICVEFIYKLNILDMRIDEIQAPKKFQVPGNFEQGF